MRYNLFLGVNVRDDTWPDPNGDVIAFYVCGNGVEPSLRMQEGSGVLKECSGQHKIMVRDDGDNENGLVEYAMIPSHPDYLYFSIDGETEVFDAGAPLCLCNDGSVRNSIGVLIDPICDPTTVVGDISIHENVNFSLDQDESYGESCEKIDLVTTDKLSSDFYSNIKDEERFSLDVSAKLSAAISSKYKNLLIDVSAKGDIYADAKYARSGEATTTSTMTSSQQNDAKSTKTSKNCVDKLKGVKYVTVFKELRLSWPVIIRCGTTNEEIDRRTITTTVFTTSSRRLDSLSDDEKAKIGSGFRFKSVENNRMNWVKSLAAKKTKARGLNKKYWKLPSTFTNTQKTTIKKVDKMTLNKLKMIKLD